MVGLAVFALAASVQPYGRVEGGAYAGAPGLALPLLGGQTELAAGLTHVLRVTAELRAGATFTERGPVALGSLAAGPSIPFGALEFVPELRLIRMGWPGATVDHGAGLGLRFGGLERGPGTLRWEGGVDLSWGCGPMDCAGIPGALASLRLPSGLYVEGRLATFETGLSLGWQRGWSSAR